MFWGGVLQTGFMESLPSTSKPPAVQWVGVGDPHGPCFVFCDLNALLPTNEAVWLGGQSTCCLIVASCLRDLNISAPLGIHL